MADSDGTPAASDPGRGHDPAARGSVPEVLGVFFRLGFISFGGPIAHLGYFHEAFVNRRRWLDERAYADLVALCQFLPGPASSQVGMSIGLLRAGYWGALAAWVGFTLPSAVILVAFAYGVAAAGELADAGWLHGLKLAAVAIVAQAVWKMANGLCPDRTRASFAIAAAVLVTAVPTAAGQIGAMILGGLAGWLLIRDPVGDAGFAPAVPVGRRTGAVLLAVFALLLGGLPVAAALADSQGLALFDAFYRAGSLVFGGGHVVLPLLESSVVAPGWVTQDDFLAGYGAAQAIPGPLFTFSAYLGAAAQPEPNGVAGAAIALLGIFLPSAFLVFGILPFWERLREMATAQSILRGINAAVVGVLLAALYDPVFTSAVVRPADFAVAIAAFLLLEVWKAPPWAVVALCAAAGAALG
jgi:chromate transporter